MHALYNLGRRAVDIGARGIFQSVGGKLIVLDVVWYSTSSVQKKIVHTKRDHLLTLNSRLFLKLARSLFRDHIARHQKLCRCDE